MKQAVLSLSGGMDSSTLLLHLLASGHKVTALSFDYGQKHRVELERATSLVRYINDKMFDTKRDNFVNHQIITLGGLPELLNSALVEGGKEVPEGHYEQENMKETVVPNRNKIFSSIIQAVALSIATETKEPVVIAMGIHAGDHAIYPDCRQEFRDADYQAFKLGNWDAELVRYYTPYLEDNKFEILQDGEAACKILGLDFDEVYKRTNTSYKPIELWVPCEDVEDMDCLECFSDYKSAASVERIEAFMRLGRPDPVAYANQLGPVSWEVVQEHVKRVLLEHQN